MEGEDLEGRDRVEKREVYATLLGHVPCLEDLILEACKYLTLLQNEVKFLIGFP